jgi:RNA polymerase sigma factor (sigma-70 family)
MNANQPDLDNLGEWSLEELLNRLQRRLERILFRYQIPPEDSEDVLQEAVLTLIYKRTKIRDPEAWLVATLRNRCLMYWRSKRSRLYDAVDANILELVAKPGGAPQESHEIQADLERAISELPDRCRSLLRLRYGLGYKPAEVAARMGYQASSIRKITSRCLAALTRQLTESGFYKDAAEESPDGPEGPSGAAG